MAMAHTESTSAAKSLISSVSTVPADEKYRGPNSNQPDLYSIPVLALGPTARRTLSRYLNPELDTAENWRFLAEALDYENLDIKNWEMHQDPTKLLLDNWGSKGGSSVGLLIEKLQLLERVDVMSDCKDVIDQDARKWIRKRKEENVQVQVPEVSSAVSSTTDELKAITVGYKAGGDVERFDAYVCYCQSDLPFVTDVLLELLERQYKLKLCIYDRDLIPGGSNTTVTAELIQNRCRRMIVVISNAFLNDGFANFCIKFGISVEPGGQSKRIIPIIIEPCNVPTILMHLTMLDYSKRDLRPWFPNRLYKAIVAPL